MANPLYGQNKADSSLNYFKDVLSGSATWDPSGIGDGDEQATNITVLGAELGDFCLASISVDIQDMVLDAQVTAADTVTCVLANNTGGEVDLGSSTASVVVIKAV